MAAASKVILILGSGPNIGQSVARAFAAKGYKVALASRGVKEEDNTADQVNIATDLSDPNAVAGVFSKLKASLGLPSVVVYNAGAATRNDEKDPLGISLSAFTRDMNINTSSAFAAAQQAALAFAQLPESASKTFIFTGNILNTTIVAFPTLTDMAVGKSATARIIEAAARAYADKGFKFYYADERKTDGSAAYVDVDGEAHATQYVQLAEQKSQGPWQQTFVKGVGYKQF